MNQSVELEFLRSTVEAFQNTPYIVLKHEGKYYKCYEIPEMKDQTKE